MGPFAIRLLTEFGVSIWKRYAKLPINARIHLSLMMSEPMEVVKSDSEGQSLAEGISDDCMSVTDSKDTTVVDTPEDMDVTEQVESSQVEMAEEIPVVVLSQEEVRNYCACLKCA